MDAVAPKITDNVAHTLFINLYMKCFEHNRPGGFYHDPTACRLLNSVDYDFTQFEKGKASSVCIALRAKHIDDLAADFIRNNEKPVLVFVGCGLDARFNRLGRNLSDRAVVYEMDLPEVMELREQLLPPGKNDILLPGSLLETDWMDKIREDHPDASFFFAMEGVCIYFDIKTVERCMSNLARRFPGSQVVFDSTNSWFIRNQKRFKGGHVPTARFQLALDDERVVTKWASNIRLRSCKHYPDFENFRHAPFMQRVMMRLVPTFRNTCRIINFAMD